MIIPFLFVKHGWVVKFGSLIVRRQCLRGGLSIDSADAFSSIVRLLVEFPWKPAHSLMLLKNSFAQPSSDFGKFLSTEQDDNHYQN